MKATEQLSPQVGSTVTLADFCPYVQEFTWKSNSGEIAPRGTRCTASENQPDSESDYALENYGEESRCFEQGSKWNQKSCNAMKQWRRYGAGCYNYRDAKCHPSDSFERMASKASKLREFLPCPSCLALETGTLLVHLGTTGVG